MALNFNGTTQFLTRGSAVITTMPNTMACWVNMNSLAATGVLQTISTTSNSDQFQTFVNTTGTVVANRRSASTSHSATTTATITTGTWHHVCGVFASATSNTIFLDGGNSVNNAVSGTPSGMTDTGIAANVAGSSFCNGIIAFPTFWSVALTAAEVLELSLRMDPRRMHPEAILSCLPLIGASPEIDYFSSTTYTVHAGAITYSGNAEGMYMARGARPLWSIPATVNASLTMTPTVTMTLSAGTGTRPPVIFSDGWGGHKYIK